MQHAWSLALRNLRRNRRRNVATVAAIAFGYAGLVLMGGYTNRVENFLRTNAVYLQHSGHVAVWLVGGLDKATSDPLKYQFDETAQKNITSWAKADPRVEFVVPYLRGMGLAGNGCATHPTALYGVDPKDLGRLVSHPEVERWSNEIVAPVKGRWMHHYPTMENGAAVSAGLAALLQKPKVFDDVQGHPPAPAVLDCDGPQEQAQLQADANVQVVSLTYDGVFSGVDTEMVATIHWAEASGEDGTMVTSLASLQKLYDTTRVTYVSLFLHRMTDAAEVARNITAAMASQGLKVEALPYDSERWNPYYVGTMAFLGSMVGVVTILVALVVVLTVSGAMTLAILERAREMGTWRALGFGRGHLAGLMVREALLLGLLGVVAGLLLGFGAAAGINMSNIRFSPPGVPGTIALIIAPSLTACLVQAAIIIPGVAISALVVVRGQLRRGVVDLLTTQTG